MICRRICRTLLRNLSQHIANYDKMEDNKLNNNEKYQFGEELFHRGTGEGVGRFLYAETSEFCYVDIYVCDTISKTVKRWNMVNVCNAEELEGLKHPWYQPGPKDAFFYIDDCGNIEKSAGFKCNMPYRYRVGNCFRTREEAESIQTQMYQMWPTSGRIFSSH